jgi:hypothetical protein
LSHRNLDEVLFMLQRLRRARADGRAVFVLGSGINAEYDVPDWSQLLIRLLGVAHLPAGADRTQMRALLNEIIPDPLLQAAATRKGYADDELWLEQLWTELTPKGDPKDHSKPLWRIADIVARQYIDKQGRRRRHIPVLTFNYDDLLEQALREALGRHQSALHSVARYETFARSVHSAGIYVYHLHGFIGDKESDVVLDAASYVNVLASPGRHWSWDCMSLYLFQQDAVALFLGLSLLDPSLRLLLTQSAAKGMTLSGLYVSKPFPKLRVRNIRKAREIASAARGLLDLFDDVLTDLSLTTYHLNSWTEINELLEVVAS